MHLPSLEDYRSNKAKMACIFVLQISVIIICFYLKEDAGAHQDQAWLVFLL